MTKLLSLAIFLAAYLVLGATPALAVDAPYISGKYVGGESVRLNWAPVPNASYQVFYGPQDNPMAHGVVVDAGGGFTISGLFKNTAYTFSAKSVRDGEVSAMSNSVVIRTGTTARPALPAQAKSQSAPVKYQGTMRTDAPLNEANNTSGRRGVGMYNLRAVTGPRTGEVTLFWNQPSESPVGDYNVVYTDDPMVEKWGMLGISPDARSFTVRGLTSGVRYSFWVAGANLGRSPWVSELAR